MAESKKNLAVCQTAILEKEYLERKVRLDAIHDLEMKILTLKHESLELDLKKKRRDMELQ